MAARDLLQVFALLHRRFVVIALVGLAACATPAPHAARVASAASVDAAPQAEATPPPWERIREEDGIVVDRREVAGSPVIAFRGEGVVGASLVRVAGVLVDVARSPEWVDRVVEARELRRLGPTTSISYSHVKSPLLVSDRDFVLRGTLEIARGRVVIRIRSVDDDAMPPARFVRGEVIDSSFVLTSEGSESTRVVAEIHADPKGSLPTWMVNLVQRSWAVKTIRALRTQVTKPDVIDPPWLTELVASASVP